MKLKLIIIFKDSFLSIIIFIEREKRNVFHNLWIPLQLPTTQTNRQLSHHYLHHHHPVDILFIYLYILNCINKSHLILVHLEKQNKKKRKKKGRRRKDY